MPRCSLCGAEKPPEAFAFRSKATGELQSYCRACHAGYRREHYLRNRDTYIQREVRRTAQHRTENRALLLAYLLSHPCVDCGETNPVLLEFDHRDLATKTGSVAVLVMTKRWHRVLAEIEKCDVRCVVCHRRRTAQQFGWSKMTGAERACVTVARLGTTDPEVVDELRVCAECGELRALGDFSIKNRSTGRRSRICRACVAARSREHYRSHKDADLGRNRRRDRRHERDVQRSLVLRYLLDHPCVDCGETDVLLLEFDHRDRATKLAAVGALVNHAGRQQILDDIAKCDVRCVRCHRAKTARELGWSRLGEDDRMSIDAGVA